MVLGSLTLAMISLQVLIPPKAPYSKLSFESLSRHIRAMKIFLDYDCEHRGYRDSFSVYERKHRGYSNSCKNLSINRSHGDVIKVQEDMEILINKLEKGLCGLDLDLTNKE